MQSVAGGDLVRLDTAVPYTGSYNDVVDQDQREVNAGFEPELKPLSVNVADYDVIAVGTPTWWYTMAPAVKAFLHGQNFAGKTVVPFMTNGGWPGRVIKDMKAACPGADFACDMQVKFDSNGGDHPETPESKINTWAQSVKGAAVRRKTMKDVMLWAGAGQIGMAIARRMGAGMKIVVGDK